MEDVPTGLNSRELRQLPKTKATPSQCTNGSKWYIFNTILKHVKTFLLISVNVCFQNYTIFIYIIVKIAYIYDTNIEVLFFSL